MKKILLLAFAVVALAACSNDGHNEPTPPRDANDKYQGGFYVLNEGQGNASINYYTSKDWALKIFQSNNENQMLGKTGTVAVFGEDKMYVVTKQSPFLVEIGLSDFVKKSELASDAISGQANSFVLIDKNRGVLTTTVGAYVVTLNPLKLEEAPFAEGGFSDVAFTGGHLLLIGSGEVKAYDAATFEFVKSLGNAKTGFAKAGGALWAGNDSKLLKINPAALTSEEIALKDGLEVYYNQFAYTPTGLQSSVSGDALYFINKITEGFTIAGRDAYKYVIATGETTKVFTAPVDATDPAKPLTFSVYGAGLNVNPQTGDLYLVYTRDGWGDNFLVTDIYVVGADGVQKSKIPYTTENETTYWFPSMIAFR